MALENRKMEVQIAVAEIEAKSQIDQQRSQFVDDLWKQFHGNAHDVAKQAHQHTHELTKQALAAQQQQDLAAQQQQEQPQTQQS